MPLYRIAQPKVIYEILSTEVIIINFETGNYYALIHIAKQIWQWIDQQMDQDQISQLVADHFRLDISKVSLDIYRFFDELVDNGLLELVDGADIEFKNSSLIIPPDWAYDAPRVQKYTDVQTLLLIDPIHEVADAGWPVIPSG